MVTLFDLFELIKIDVGFWYHVGTRTGVVSFDIKTVVGQECRTGGLKPLFKHTDVINNRKFIFW